MAFLMSFVGVVRRERQKFISERFCLAVTLKVIVLNFTGFLAFFVFFDGIGSAFVNNFIEVADDLPGKVVGLRHHITFSVYPHDRFGI